MLLGALGANLLGNMLAGIIAVQGINRAGKGFLRACYRSPIKNKDF